MKALDAIRKVRAWAMRWIEFSGPLLDRLFRPWLKPVQAETVDWASYAHARVSHATRCVREPSSTSSCWWCWC